MTLYNLHRMNGYRNLSEELVDIFVSDTRLTCEKIEGRGLIFFLALFCVLCISLLKVAHCLWTYFFDNQMTLGEWQEQQLKDEKRLHRLTENEVTSMHLNIENERISKFKTPQENSLTFLRMYLLNHNNTLHAQVVKSIKHNVSDEIIMEYMHTGKIIKPYQTEYINFGEKINKAIKDALGNRVSLKKIKDCPYPCIVVLNGETEKISEELGNVFLNDVMIKFDVSLNK